MPEHDAPESKPTLSYLDALTPRVRKFVEAYVGDPEHNGTQAAKVAGFSAKSAHVQASRLLNDVKVQRAIREALDAQIVRMQLRADRVLSELLCIGTLDIRDVFNDDFTIKKLSEIPEHARRAIAAIDVDELVRHKGRLVVDKHSEQLPLIEGAEGKTQDSDLGRVGQTKSIKFHNKLAALQLLGEHLKLFASQTKLPSGSTLESIIAAAAGKEPSK